MPSGPVQAEGLHAPAPPGLFCHPGKGSGAPPRTPPGAGPPGPGKASGGDNLPQTPMVPPPGKAGRRPHAGRREEAKSVAASGEQAASASVSGTTERKAEVRCRGAFAVRAARTGGVCSSGAKALRSARPRRGASSVWVCPHGPTHGGRPLFRPSPEQRC